MSDTRYRIGASETNDHTAGGRIGKARQGTLSLLEDIQTGGNGE